MAPKPKEDETKIACTSPGQLSEHINEMHILFSQPESEHNWEKFAKSLAKLAALTRGGAYKLDNFVASIGPSVGGGVGEKIVQCMLTERAGLSKFALELLTSLAPRLNDRFTGALPRLFVPPLLELIRRTNNIIRERAETCLFKIIETCHLVLLIQYLTGAVKDSAVKLRKAVGVGMKIAVEKWQAGGKAEEVESVVRALTNDKDVDVRKVAKELWERYRETWPERVDGFTAPMTPTMRKRLDIKGTQSAAAGSSSTLARPTRAKAPTKPKPMDVHSVAASTALMQPPSHTLSGRPRLEGLGAGPPTRPAPFHGSESFASSSRHPIPPPPPPPAHMSRSATYSHSQFVSSSSVTGLPPSSSFQRTTSVGHPPHASTSSASYTFPHPVPPPPPSHSYTDFQSVSRAPLSRAGSVADLAAASSTTRNGAPSFSSFGPSHGRTLSSTSSSAPSSATVAAPAAALFGLEISTRPKRQGGPKGPPLRGGEGGGVPYNPISRKHAATVRGAPIAATLEAPTTPISSPAKSAVEGGVPSPQIGDLLQKAAGSEGLLLEEKPLPKKVASSTSSAPLVAQVVEPVAADASDEVEERPTAGMARSISFLDEPLEEDLPLPPLVPLVREDQLSSPVETLVDPTSPLLLLEGDKPEEAEQQVVCESQAEAVVVAELVEVSPQAGDHGAAETAKTEVVQEEADERVSEGHSPSEVKSLVSAEVAVESVAQEVAPAAEAVKSVEVSKASAPVKKFVATATKPIVASSSRPTAATTKPNVPAAASSSRLVRAPSKVFKPVSSAAAAGSAKSTLAPVPARPKSTIVPARPAAAAAPLARSTSTTLAAQPAASTSKLASSTASTASKATAPVPAPAPVVARRPVMKMKAGPPPKVEAEPRKERTKTKAALPSFKPVSRAAAAAAAAGGPGMGTIKKVDGVGVATVAKASGPVAGAKAKVGTTSVAATTSKAQIASGVKASMSGKEAVAQPAQKAPSTGDVAALVAAAASVPIPSSPVLAAACIALPPSPIKSAPSPAPAPTTSAAPSTPIAFPTLQQQQPSDFDLAQVILRKADREAGFTPRSKTVSILSASSDMGDAVTVYSDSGEDRETETEDDDADHKDTVKFNPEIARKRVVGATTRKVEGGAAATGKGPVMGSPRKREFGGVRDQNVVLV